MRCEKIIILFYFSFFFVLSGYAQQNNSPYIFRHIDQSDGLLHNRVLSIVQDGRGFIWMLTPNGLQRYDGSRFVNYPYNPNDPAGITYTIESGLFADKKNNRLWITNESIEMLDLQKNKFTVYHTNELLKNKFFSFSTYTDTLKNNWYAGNFGVIVNDRKIKKWVPFFLSPSWLNPDKSNHVSIDQTNGDIWVANWEGLFWFDKKTKKLYSHSYNPLHNSLLQLMDKRSLSSIFMDSERNVWISSIGGPEFYRYNSATQKITSYSLSGISQPKNKTRDATLLVYCFFEDDHHTIWIGTQNAGLLKYDRQSDNFISINNQKENHEGIQYSYEIISIFQDKEENIWLGTDKGITIFNPYRQYFQSVYHDENNPSSLPKSEIQGCIETDNGDILAGTWGGGITIYDNQWHFKKNIRFSHGPYEYNLIWSFVQNDDGTIWIGCQHGYIHIYNPANGSISTIHPPELNNFTIWCMAKDNSGNIWIGLHNGKIAKWDKSQNKFYYYNDSLPGITQTYTPVHCIFIDKERHCWACTESGLKEFDMGKRIFTAVYSFNADNSLSVQANTIHSIEAFNDSTLVMGTAYSGLNFFNTRSKTFSHLTTSDGLSSNSIYALKEDKNHHIWFTTDYGLYKFIPADKKFIRYNIEPGIINSSFTSPGFYSLKDGRWVTYTSTEIISFYPQKVDTQESDASRVEITGCKINDKRILIDSLLAENKPLHLNHKQNFFTIEFASLNFSALQQLKYYYRLSGVNNDWVNADTKHFADYTNLGPGEYTFNVKADTGNETSGITSFKIIIAPPFWKTWWFRATVMIAVVMLLYWIIKRRIRFIRHEAEMKQKIAETEMMALRAQMNPHFIFNCLNSIDNLIQNNEKEKATTYLAKFAKLIRAILENSKNNSIPCWKDLETLKLYLELEEFRWDKKFSYQLNIAPEILQGDYKVPPMIIQPYVENAIHHGLLNKDSGSKKLTVEVKVDKNYINYIVEDNGIGRKKAEEYKRLNRPTHQSMGLDITRDRINLFNQKNNGSVIITDLYNENKQATGTKVEVHLLNQS